MPRGKCNFFRTGKSSKIANWIIIDTNGIYSLIRQPRIESDDEFKLKIKFNFEFANVHLLENEIC